MTTQSKLTPSDLSALMCSRICHDLISPVGALGTALEVLGDDSNVDMHGDALELVKMSAKQASSKLQYLRMAFGAAGSSKSSVGVDELKSLVGEMYGDGKIEISWNGDLAELEKSRARLLLNLVMLAVQAIPRGGQLTIICKSINGSDELVLRAQGRKARLDEAVEKTLAGRAPEDGFDGRTIQPFYAGMIVREIKGQVFATATEDEVVFKAICPAIGAQNAA